MNNQEPSLDNKLEWVKWYRANTSPQPSLYYALVEYSIRYDLYVKGLYPPNEELDEIEPNDFEQITFDYQAEVIKHAKVLAGMTDEAEIAEYIQNDMAQSTLKYWGPVA